jgi:hypothetical protein
MRLLVTADLHYNHARSRETAEEVIDRMNAAGGDVLLVVGDTAAADGDALEQCLGRFRFKGPRLLLAGNHELWTAGPDSYKVFTEGLPRRAQELGWQWLETQPFAPAGGDVAIVGSVGWYDYSFAADYLGIPRRFYEHKVSPAAAERFTEFAHLLDRTDDIGEVGRQTAARWNDGRYVKLGRSDEQFLGECLARLDAHLASAPVASARTVVAAVHHVPFRELLPGGRHEQRDFAKAFLGSGRIGETLLRHPRVRHAFCGHSHFAAEAQVGHVHAVNIGSGYRWKTFHTLDV